MMQGGTCTQNTSSSITYSVLRPTFATPALKQTTSAPIHSPVVSASSPLNIISDTNSREDIRERLLTSTLASQVGATPQSAKSIQSSATRRLRRGRGRINCSRITKASGVRSSMSVYSTSSASTEHSNYSNPPARRYKSPSFPDMSSSRQISAAEKGRMILALQTHQVNTLVELRRIERVFASLGSPDVSAPMTAAWSYYVNSHSLLSELRVVTRNYPFSSECLEEAKRRVYADPLSNRSWNLCWLVLSKVHNDHLIPYYAQYQAAQPAMWGGNQPTSDETARLANAFISEWSQAVNQMLRHWTQPPTR